MTQTLNISLVSVGMLNSDDLKKKDSAVKCLEVLSTSKPDHWRSILDAGRFFQWISYVRISFELA